MFRVGLVILAVGILVGCGLTPEVQQARAGGLQSPADTSDTADTHQRLILKKEGV